MAVNKRRGEVPVELDGRQYRLRLTLGALAELEAAYEADDLGALVERFSRGRLSAGDLIRVLGAGLQRARGTTSPTRRWQEWRRRAASAASPRLSPDC